MSKISLKHTSGKVVSLNSPTAEPGANDVAFKLPNADGSAGQYMKTDGSGNLAFATLPTSGKFASYAIIADQKATNATGGSSSTGSFNTRDLNTELADPDGIVSISSNQFTLQAGSYLIKASAPAFKAQRHQIILQNITDSSVSIVGSCEYNDNSAQVQTRRFLTGRVTISAAKVFEIRHRIDNAESTFGLGVECNFDTLASIYTIVEIFKEA